MEGKKRRLQGVFPHALYSGHAIPRRYFSLNTEGEALCIIVLFSYLLFSILCPRLCF